MVAETWVIGKTQLPALGRSADRKDRGGSPLDTPASGASPSVLRRRVSLAGVHIDLVDASAARDRLRGFMRSGAPHQVVTVNLDFLSIANRDLQFRDTINHADLAVADGMPLVWLSRLQRQPLPERITGVDLVDVSCGLAAEFGESVFLLGAGPGVAEAAACRLQRTHPSLQIAGVYSPPFGPLTPREDARIVQKVKRASPGVLFVALGAPRQDLWIRTHLHQLGVPVQMGVGGTFDLIGGVLRRAPIWMQHSGLEWAFRLGQEPHRLWRRYLLNDLPTLSRLVFDVRASPLVESVVETLPLLTEPAMTPPIALG